MNFINFKVAFNISHNTIIDNSSEETPIHGTILNVYENNVIDVSKGKKLAIIIIISIPK